MNAQDSTRTKPRYVGIIESPTGELLAVGETDTHDKAQALAVAALTGLGISDTWYGYAAHVAPPREAGYHVPVRIAGGGTVEIER